MIDRCPKLNCLKAIRPTGFCCDICASVLKIEHQKASIDFESIENRLANLHLDKYQNKVAYFISKITSTKIEIIFTDVHSETRESKKFANEIMNFLNVGL